MKKCFAAMLVFGLAAACFVQTPSTAQTEGLTRDTSPPPPNKIYENDLRLPDDAGKLILPDEAYLRWPLPPGEEAYAHVDGMAMKKQIPEITAISRKSRDDGNQFWGRHAVRPDDSGLGRCPVQGDRARAGEAAGNRHVAALVSQFVGGEFCCR